MLNNDANQNSLSRLELLKLAQTLRVSDADVMTRAELRAAIERARRPDPRPSPQPATWLGVARRLIASIVEQGLHLPDAAALIRGEGQLRPMPSGPPPVATVTLARIYAAQGHLERGISTLDEVLKSDPDHDLARELRAQLAASLAERREQERQARAAATASPNGRGPAAAAEAAAAQPNELAKATQSAESGPPSELLSSVSEGRGTAAAATDAVSDDEITLSGAEAAPEVETQRNGGASALESALTTEPEPATLSEPASNEPIALGEPVTSSEPIASSQPIALGEPIASSEPIALGEPVASSEPIASSQPIALGEPTSPPAVSEPVAERALEPRPAGLVLIETSEPGTYLYWELAIPAVNGNGPDVHWVSVVMHAPRGAGCERRERRFPVHRSSGAVRLEGLPAHAVVRAKLSRGDAAEAPPLVVAGCVWASEIAPLERAEARFLPYPTANPLALAARAADHLASAAPMYC